jgi:hypothetical protein
MVRTLPVGLEREDDDEKERGEHMHQRVPRRRKNKGQAI